MSLSLALGCGDETGLEKRYPVSGTVTYHDQPVKHGQIHFLPESVGGRSATGVIEDGRYSLTTMVPDDGAVPGKYQVTIVSKDIDFTKVKETIAKKGGTGRQKDIIKAASTRQEPDPHQVRLGPILGADGRGRAAFEYLQLQADRLTPRNWPIKIG